MTAFDDPFWTLEQALSWLLTYDRELVAQNSEGALREHVRRLEQGGRKWKDKFTPLLVHLRKSSLTGLIGSQQLKEAGAASETHRYISCQLDLLRMLQQSIVKATGIPRKQGERVEIPPTHWIDFKIDTDANGLQVDAPATGQGQGRYRDIRVLRAELLEARKEPSKRETSRARAADEAYQRFYDIIAPSPHKPTTSKAKELALARKEISGLSHDVAERQWQKAITDLEASKWTAPGRRKSKG